MFLIWPPRVWSQPPTPAGLRLLRLSAFLFVAATLAVGVRAFVLDLRVAFLESWMRMIPTPVARQMAEVERAAGRESPLLVFYSADKPWFPRMWQRALYPRIVILQAREHTRRDTVRRLRDRYGIRYAISMSAPTPDAGIEEVRDLGPVLGAADRVWFGTLRR